MGELLSTTPKKYTSCHRTEAEKMIGMVNVILYMFCLNKRKMVNKVEEMAQFLKGCVAIIET